MSAHPNPEGGLAVFIGVGSNIDPERNVPLALEALARLVRVVASSTFYWSEPVARPDQPRFLNGVWQVCTRDSARQFKFEILRLVEEQLGRRRVEDKHAARTIDLDVLLFGDQVWDEPDLQIPDPEIVQRAFLWQPLSELAPEPLAHLGLHPGADLRREAQCLEPALDVTGRLRAKLLETN